MQHCSSVPRQVPTLPTMHLEICYVRLWSLGLLSYRFNIQSDMLAAPYHKMKEQDVRCAEHCTFGDDA